MSQNLSLKYPASHFIETDTTQLKALVEAFPLATLISSHKDEIMTSYLPLLWESSSFLVGHLDANNPHTSLLTQGKKAKLVFHGPEAYISPAHFNTNELPTYNYCKVEVDGIIKKISNADLKEAIIALTKQLEGEHNAYILTHKENRLQQLIKYIYGFKIEVTQIRGRFKMSQDKSKAHQTKALELMYRSLDGRQDSFLNTYLENLPSSS